MPGVVDLLGFSLRDLLTASTGEQFANTREPTAVGQGEIGTFADRRAFRIRFGDLASAGLTGDVGMRVNAIQQDPALTIVVVKLRAGLEPDLNR